MIISRREKVGYIQFRGFAASPLIPFTCSILHVIYPLHISLIHKLTAHQRMAQVDRESNR